jgi:hypothetical protein
MKLKLNQRWVRLSILCMVIFLSACGGTPDPGLTPTPTLDSTPTPAPALQTSPTPTPTPTISVPVAVTQTPKVVSRCEGLGGSIEVQVLAGPAAVVGLEPYAVGEIPFSVAADGGKYKVQGSGPIAYEEVLEEAWGSYTVSLDLDITIDGECGEDAGSEALQMTITLSGNQMVEVRAMQFSGDYPWSGTAKIPATFLLEEGNSTEAEGWGFVLHLNH